MDMTDSLQYQSSGYCSPSLVTANDKGIIIRAPIIPGSIGSKSNGGKNFSSGIVVVDVISLMVSKMLSVTGSEL